MFKPGELCCNVSFCSMHVSLVSKKKKKKKTTILFVSLIQVSLIILVEKCVFIIIIIIIIIVSGVHHECENKKHHVTVYQKCLIITCRGKILATRPKPTLRVVCVWLNTSNPP